MHRTTKPIGLLLILTAAAWGAETRGEGQIAGLVTGTKGAPVASAIVMATSQPPEERTTAFVAVSATALAGTDGAFTIPNLPAGTYKLCAEQHKAGLLNPCVWSDTAMVVKVGEGEKVGDQVIRMAVGTQMTVRLRDTAQRLTEPAAKATGGAMLIGIAAKGGIFVPAESVEDDAEGRKLTFLVPAGESVDLSVSGGAFSLADEKGAALTEKTTKIPVVAAAEGTSTVVLQVTAVAP